MANNINVQKIEDSLKLVKGKESKIFILTQDSKGNQVQKEVDVKTANNFDINSVLLRTGKSLKKNEFNAKPNFICNNLCDASKKIINYLND